jgi:predicted RecB family nuclease
MALRLTATTLKSFFQYRCERQVRYKLLAGPDREALAIREATEDAASWARAGLDFEDQVIAELARSEAVLRAPAGEALSAVQTAAFLRRRLPETYAHQLRLALPADGDFHRRWSMPEGVELAVAFPDLIQAVATEGDRAVFRPIDIKAVFAPAPFHKIQVAFYSLLLDSLLREMGADAVVDQVGEIWHPVSAPAGPSWQRAPFRLKGYQAQVADFLRRTLPGIAAAELAPGRDETRFHLYFKCEQCPFLPHCAGAIAEDLPRDRWDVSAVPGLSQASKQALVEQGIATVGDLAAAGDVARLPSAGWALRTRGDQLVRRARSLIAGRVERLPGRQTCLMPPRVDVGIFLSVDVDPVEGRLAALGCLREQEGRREFTIEVVTRHGPEAERAALLRALSALLRYLAEVDAHNATGAGTWHSHIFVYEPSEAADLRAALGRHLADPAVRGGLLELLRLFPPEELLPEPEYRGVHHLPATALRGVVEGLYALPVRVAHDLNRVGAAFAQADPPLAETYRPRPELARPFSSRLSIDASRALKAGSLPAAVVEEDVRARLGAVAALSRWILADSARAVPPFLRLKKRPFRFQRSFDPLDGGDLDVLRAQELLESRTRELEALVRLAEPPEVRLQRGGCLGPLELLEQTPSPRPWAATRLVFHSPAIGRQAEVDAESRGIMLSNGDPDFLLDPSAWKGLFVTIDDLRDRGTGLLVVVDVGKPSWRIGLLPRLLDRRPPEWFLDRAHDDINTPRLVQFLQYLARSPGRP